MPLTQNFIKKKIVTYLRYAKSKNTSRRTDTASIRYRDIIRDMGKNFSLTAAKQVPCTPSAGQHAVCNRFVYQ